MRKLAIALSLAAALTGSMALNAHADLVMTESDGVGDSFTQSGSSSVVYVGAVGSVFSTNIVSGLSLATPFNFQMDLGSSNLTATGSGVLTITLTENSVPSLVSYPAYGLSAIVGTSSSFTVSYKALYNGSVVFSQTFAPGAIFYVPSVSETTAPSTLEEIFTITSTGEGSSSLDASLTASVPEPGTLFLLGAGLLGLGAFRTRFKKA